jgi:hypothetical protein
MIPDTPMPINIAHKKTKCSIAKEIHHAHDHDHDHGHRHGSDW